MVAHVHSSTLHRAANSRLSQSPCWKAVARYRSSTEVHHAVTGSCWEHGVGTKQFPCTRPRGRILFGSFALTAECRRRACTHGHKPSSVRKSNSSSSTGPWGSLARSQSPAASPSGHGGTGRGAGCLRGLARRRPTLVVFVRPSCSGCRLHVSGRRPSRYIPTLDLFFPSDLFAPGVMRSQSRGEELQLHANTRSNLS